jgi:hypothetical protein
MSLDLTSSYYSLVVLASTTLGLSTYIHNHYVSAFRENQLRCKDAGHSRKTEAPGFDVSENTKERKEQLAVQMPVQILKPVAFLASALPYSALGQLINLFAKYWGDINWITAVLVYSLLLWFAIVFGATLYILFKLNKLRMDVEEIKDSVDSVLTTIEAEYRGYSHAKTNGTPQHAIPTLKTPRVRQP